MLRPFAHPVACCWMLLRVVAQSLKPVKLFGQKLPTFRLFCDRRSVAQQCWMRLHSSANIVGATHAHYAWFTKTYRLYFSHDALQVPNSLGVVASVCTPMPTQTQQLPTCWELLRPFARGLQSHLKSPWVTSSGLKSPQVRSTEVALKHVNAETLHYHGWESKSVETLWKPSGNCLFSIQQFLHPTIRLPSSAGWVLSRWTRLSLISLITKTFIRFTSDSLVPIWSSWLK